MQRMAVVLCLYSVTVVLVLVVLVTSSVLGTGDQELPGAASSPLQRPLSQHIHLSTLYTGSRLEFSADLSSPRAF